MTKRMDNLEFVAIVTDEWRKKQDTIREGYHEANGFAANAYSVASIADRLIGLAKRHQTLCEAVCNYMKLDEFEHKVYRLEERISRETQKIGPGFANRFQHDPRGATVKLTVPSGFTNDWGQEGVVVP